MRLISWGVASYLGLAAALGASPSAAKQHYESGRYAEAQSEYQRLLREKPDDSRLSYNAATAAYKHGDLTNATLGFENALSTQDLKLQQKAYYNLGNTRFRMGDMAQSPEEKLGHWEESVKDFGSALKLQPDDADAKHNQALVQQMLEELKKQMPKQKQKNPNQDKDDKKDEDKDQDQNQDSDDSKDKQDSKEQESKDQKQDGDSEKKESDQKDQGKDSQEGKDSKGGDDQKEQDQASKSGDGKDEKGKDKEDKASDAASKSDAQAKKEAEEERQAAAVGKMTPQMAEKLLDAQKGNEKAMLFRVQQQRPKGKDRVFKNW